MAQNLWVFKTVEEADRASQTVDNYNDELSSKYNYDSNVKNYKNIKIGDNIILIDKKKILGFAQVENIESSHGKKTIRRCPDPECRSTNIEPRKTLKPLYRCNKGHVFDQPTETVTDVRKFTAYYSNTFNRIGNDDDNLHQLRPFYTNGYNRNNSMQLLDNEALNIFSKRVVTGNVLSSLLSPLDAWDGSGTNDYKKNEDDERPIVFRQIKERRGQQKFRSALLDRYGLACMITGCQIVDILEAAHINPYRGINDNHIANGLILRADIHTLFDLNLVGIDPDTFVIHFSKKTATEYREFDNKVLKCITKQVPSKSALKTRWELFTENR